MRKLLTWIVVTLGLAALIRKLRGRHRTDEPPPGTDVDPADELRRTIAVTREDEMPVPGVPPGPEPQIDEPTLDEPTTDEPGIDESGVSEPRADEPGVDERRASVHDQGRAAIEEMQVSSDEPDR
jgi:hypothetical protein